MKPERRLFLKHVVFSISSVGILGITSPAQAQATILQENDPDAVALGYRADASQVDQEKFPRFTPNQHCSKCMWYQGDSASLHANCSLYPNKLVAAKGWCSGWAKKS